MQKAKPAHVSIKVKNFGKGSDIFSLLFTSMIFLLGLMGAYWSWESGLCSVAIIAILYFLQKRELMKIATIVSIVVVLISASSYLLHIDFLETLLTTMSLSFGLFLKTAWIGVKEKKEFEIFYLDCQTMRCLAIREGEYKGYGFNPKSYLKTYDVKNISHFKTVGKHLLVIIEGDIIRPKELAEDNTREINQFVASNLAHLLNGESSFNEALKAEDRFYFYKLWGGRVKQERIRC